MLDRLQINKPDYHAQGLVNLMSRLGQEYGRDAFDYPACRVAGLENLGGYDNIILFIVDGLGYEYLLSTRGLFKEYCQSRLSAVFPSTTAASITTFLTGQAPQQHGLTGWFTYLEEVGGVTAVLPCMLRGSQSSISEQGIDIASLYNHPIFFDELACSTHIVSPNWIIATEFNHCHSGKAQLWGYEGMTEMFAQIQQCVSTARERQYIYAYWPEFDHLSHLNRNHSEIVAEHFQQLQVETEKFLAAIQGTNTLLLITADHGFIDTEPERCITVNEHPHLQDCLRLPLSGEPRSAYCYLKEGKQEMFLDYIETHFSQQLDCIPSKYLLDENWFGLGEPHPQLAKRIGDYTLLMKDNYIIKDWLDNEKHFFHYGVHGGVSSQEMYVPLIAIPA